MWVDSGWQAPHLHQKIISPSQNSMQTTFEGGNKGGHKDNTRKRWEWSRMDGDVYCNPWNLAVLKVGNEKEDAVSRSLGGWKSHLLRMRILEICRLEKKVVNNVFIWIYLCDV